MSLLKLFNQNFRIQYIVNIASHQYSFNFQYSGTDDLWVSLFENKLEVGVDYTIANGTRLASGFYTGATITLLSTEKTSNLAYELSEEKPLYIGRFYNYDNDSELNNNQDLVDNISNKINDMERMLIDFKNIPFVIEEIFKLFSTANTNNNFLTLDNEGKLSPEVINSILAQLAEGITIGIPSGTTRPISAAGFWFNTTTSEFYIYDGTTDRTLDSYAKRLTLNVVDALDSTKTSDALSANQGRILLGNINNRANIAGDPSLLFSVATATASSHAANKSYVDTGLSAKASLDYVNERAQSISQANITTAFSANILNDNTLSSTDASKTSSTLAIKTYIDESSANGIALYTNPTLLTGTNVSIDLYKDYTTFDYIVFTFGTTFEMYLVIPSDLMGTSTTNPMTLLTSSLFHVSNTKLTFRIARGLWKIQGFNY